MCGNIFSKKKTFQINPECVSMYTYHFLKEEAVAVTSRARPDIARSAAAFAISVREQCHLSQVNLSCN